MECGSNWLYTRVEQFLRDEESHLGQTVCSMSREHAQQWFDAFPGSFVEQVLPMFGKKLHINFGNVRKVILIKIHLQQNQ